MQGKEQNEKLQEQNLKLISVTRQDISGGYQTVQTAHAVADFAYQFPIEFKKWKETSNSIICLATKDEKSLHKLSQKLEKKGIVHSKFYEPDVNQQLTAITIEPSIEGKKATSWLPLANKITGDIDKHTVPVLTESDVVDKMKSTYQFESQSVYDHGVSVHNYFEKIIDTLVSEKEYPDLKIPQYLIDNKNLIFDIYHKYGYETIRKYCIYHDIGKPYCREVDENGKQHFPNHAQVSFYIYNQIFKEESDKIIADMILHDMDIHLAKPSSMDDYFKLTQDRQILHMVIGLAELLSNAQMFGGLDSVGFKIKYKNFCKVSKLIIEKIKTKNNTYENL